MATTVTLTGNVPNRLAASLGLAAGDQQTGDVLALPHRDALTLVQAGVARFGSVGGDAALTPTVATFPPGMALPATDAEREQFIPARLSPAALAAAYVPAAGTSTVAGAKTFSGSLTVTGIAGGLRTSTWLGIGAGVGSARNPFYQNSVVSSADIQNALTSGGGDDYVGHQVNVKFEGGFAGLVTNLVGSIEAGSSTLTLSSGTFTSPIFVGYHILIPGAGAGGGLYKGKLASITNSTTAVLDRPADTAVTAAAIQAAIAPDPNYLFGSDWYIITGTNPGDLSGIDHLFANLFEAHLNTPGAALASMKGAVSEAYIEATATGASITDVMAHHITAVTNRSNAAVTNAYGLRVESPTTGSNKWSIYTAGSAPVHFGGAVRMGGTDVSTAAVFLNLYAGASTGDGARLSLRGNSVDGYANLFLPQSGAKFQISDGTNIVFEFFRDTGLLMTRRGRFNGNTAADQVLIARGVSGQTADVLRVEDSNTNALLAVTAGGVVALRNGVVPAGNPTSGGYLYAEGGALKYRGSSGTVTTLAAA